MNYLDLVESQIRLLIQSESYINFRNKLTSSLNLIRQKNGNLLIFANGGSSAIASHFSVDLLKNFSIRALIPADHGIITCFSNDYGYDQFCVEYIKRLKGELTTVVLISSSGASRNILNAAAYCNANCIECYGLGGFGEESHLSRLIHTDFILQVNSTNYNVIELTHLAALLDTVEQLKNTLSPSRMT